MININNYSFGDWVILSSFIIITIILAIIGFSLQKNKVRLGGKAPIRKSLYTTGKICIWGTWVALVLQSLQVDLRVIPIMPYLEFISIILVILSFIIFIASFISLGKSLRVGLPDEKTELKVNGIYKLSRNPIYVGFYLLAIASVIYTLNPVVLIFALLGSYLHHKIVIAEEQFLIKEFGSKYLHYAKRVRRYI